MLSWTTRILTALLALVCSGAIAQQQIGYTQFVWDPVLVNPAATATSALKIRAFHRMQWVGIEGAPTSQSFTMYGPLFGKQTGAGVSFFHDEIGVTRTAVARLNGAYTANIDRYQKVSFGLSVQYGMQFTDWDSTNPNDPNDEALQFGPGLVQEFNGGVGLNYASRRTFGGFSVPLLLEFDQAGLFRTRRHYYFMASQLFPVNQYFDIQPSAMLRLVRNAPTQLDIQCAGVFNKSLYAGLGYRFGDAMNILLKYTPNKLWTFGYAFDLTVSGLSNNAGSHEIMLGYDFGSGMRRTGRRYY